LNLRWLATRTEQHTRRYPIATRHLGKARARLHRLLNNAAFVRLAEAPPMAIACRRNDERLRRAVSHMIKDTVCRCYEKARRKATPFPD